MDILGIDFGLSRMGLALADSENKLPVPFEVLKEVKADLNYDKELFEKLRNLRKQIAKERAVPPFVIFGDISLREMSHYLPKDKNSLSKIKGVGEMKLETFGDKFLESIKNHVQHNNS